MLALRHQQVNSMKQKAISCKSTRYVAGPNKSAGEIIDLSLDEEPVDSSYHKVCLYVEYYDWFVYFHVFDCGILNVATVVSGKDIYYADQQATTLAILENGDVVVGIENIANVQISLNTKLNRTTRERERSA